MSITETALGVPRIKNGGIVTAKYYVAFNGALQSLVERTKNLFYHLDFLYQFSTSHKKMQSSVALMNNVSESVSLGQNTTYYRIIKTHKLNSRPQL